jgi:ABC-2 type transport system ATP-binding protein
VARCLLGDPDLLILDEPANGLDPAGILEFRVMVRTLVEEGRTVMLSSHLLDEVEKVCDAVAILDRGKVVAQGSISELSGEGSRSVLLLADQSGRAVQLLAGHPSVRSIEENGHGIRAQLGHVTTEEARSVAADLNRRLVEAGLRVFGIELPRATLEERFLEITHRMQEEVPA